MAAGNQYRIRGPGVKILEQPLKSIAEFESFKHSIIFTLRQDSDFKPFLKSGLKFGSKTAAKPNRDLVDDPGEHGTKADVKCESVDFMLETISSYCPLIPHKDIENCGSLAEVWQIIRLHNSIETSGALLNDVWNVTRRSDETPQALWSRLKQQYDDSLLRKDTLTYVDDKLDNDEQMSPTLHNVIILHWLQIIHPKLRNMVTQRFSKELRNATYASIWPEISRSIDTFLKDLNDEESVIRRYEPSEHRYTDRPAQRSPWRSRGFAQRSRGNPTTRPTTSKCDYCRLTGRRSWYNHCIEDCMFLKKERPASVKAVELEDDYDEHYEEYWEAYPSESVPAKSSQIHIVNRVFTHPSPVLPLWHAGKSYQLTLDTGGTCNILDDKSADELKCTVRATNQRARMADGETDLEVLGESDVKFTRDNKIFTFSALVCKMSSPTILAGMPFLSIHDIAIRPAKSEIILEGTESIFYDAKATQSSLSRRMTSYTVRCPATEVILPGEATSFQLPSYLSKETTVILEPRYDNSYQSLLSHPWPSPKVYPVKDGTITVPNTSSEPIQMKKNQHVCNIQTQIPDLIVADTASQLQVQSESQPLPSLEDSNTTCILAAPNSGNTTHRKVTPYSTPVQLNPDGVLSAKESTDFQVLLNQYDEVFNPKIARYNQKAGKCYVEVNMGPNPPPQQKGSIPFYGRNNTHELQQMCDGLEVKGVLRRPQDIGVTVENLNTTFLVKKKDTDDKRMVTDFASISDYCRPTPTLMPDVDSTLRQIASWKYLLKSDFTEAYFQIPLKKSSIKYCGVVTPFKGVRVYTVGCMGLPGTEVALEELTSLLFGHLVMKGCVAKLADDLFVGGSTPEELLSNFEEILQILLENDLRLSAKKTTIAPKEVVILGWVWSSGYLKASPHKLSALTECNPPSTLKALKSYIGAYRYLARVVKDYASVLMPLENMVPGKSASNTVIQWLPDQLAAFRKAQSTLKSAKAIALPRPNDTIQIITDAAVNPTAIAATMFLLRDDKVLLGGFFNSKLPLFQRRWLPCELEGVAIGISLAHFAPYILQSLHRPVILTDSKACVDAVGKLNRGEFSASARLTTFLSTVSRYRAQVKHIQGNKNVLSDYISRNPVDCENQKCQVCAFIRQSMTSVISAVSANDVQEGLVQLPYTNKKAWIEVQQECPDLRNVSKYLSNGTSPGKKGRSLRHVKQYIRSKVIISTEGTLVVRQVEPFLPQSEKIVVPQTVLHGILTVFHIKLCHPSRYQLVKNFNRHFFALKLESAAAEVTNACHQCASLRDLPSSLKKESTDEPPTFLTERCAADVIKRNSQLIMVMRETVSSYTQTQLIERETAEDISTSLLTLASVIRPSRDTPMIIRVDPHPSHRSLFNSQQSKLTPHNITLELGRELNINKNPVGECAVKEVIRELLNIQPEGGPVSSLTLSLATANLNSRIRAPGVSAHEIFTKRDQTTGTQLSLDDIEIISSQHKRRLLNHKSSEKCKARGKPELPSANITVGSLIHIYEDRSKLQARPRYVVLSINGEWCRLRRFASQQLGRITYDAKLTECYPVPVEITGDNNPHSLVENDVVDTEVVCIPKNIVHQEAPHSDIDESSSSDEDYEEDVGEEAIADEVASYCKLCHKEVKNSHMGLICDKCNEWSHRNCLKMTKKHYKELTKSADFPWTCPACPAPEEVVDDEVVPPDIE